MPANMSAAVGVGDVSGAASSFRQVLSKNTVLPERFFVDHAEPITSTAKMGYCIFWTRQTLIKEQFSHVIFHVPDPQR